MPNALDFRLIRELQKDSRQTNTMLAKTLEISESTVRRRIAHLGKEEMVKFTIIMNPEQLGFQVSATMLFKVDPLKVDEISDRIAEIENFYSVAVVAGNYDIVVSGYFESVDNIYEMIRNQISKIEGIKTIETMIMMKRKKRAY